MDIIKSCKSYFNGFNELSTKNDISTNAIAILKIISYFSIVIPTLMGTTYGIASLIGRVKNLHDLENTDQKIQSLANNQFLSGPKNSLREGVENQITHSNRSNQIEIYQQSGHNSSRCCLHHHDNQQNPLEEQEPVQIDQQNNQLLQEPQSLNRNQVIEIGIANELNWCDCNNAHSKEREDMEQQIVSTTLGTFPPKTYPSLNIFSLGSGGLLQDLTILNALVLQGYKEINLDLFDPSIDEMQVKAFKDIVKNRYAITINVRSYKNSLPNDRKYQIMHGIDFDPMTYDFRVWHTIFDVLLMVDGKGFLYLHKGEGKLLYQPSEFLKIQNENTLNIMYKSLRYDESILSDESFFLNVLFRVMEAVCQGVKKISIYCENHKNVLDRVHRLCKKYNDLFNGLGVLINFYSKIEESTQIDLFHLDANKTKPTEELYGCHELLLRLPKIPKVIELANVLSAHNPIYSALARYNTGVRIAGLANIINSIWYPKAEN